MALAKFRQAGRTVYRHVKEGMKSVDAIIHKAAMVYTLTHPLIRQAYDTRALDAGLMDGYVKYQQARQLTSQIDTIVN